MVQFVSSLLRILLFSEQIREHLRLFTEFYFDDTGAGIFSVLY